MNFLLKKVFYFKNHHQKSSYILSLTALILCALLGFYVISLQKAKFNLVAKYQDDYKKYYYLQKANDFLTTAKVEPLNYMKDELEQIRLLNHLKHRHEQSKNPSVPIDLNPRENCINHLVSTISSKGLKRESFLLTKPILADEEDLKQIFTIIDHKSIFPFTISKNPPYLFFTNFNLKKHHLSSCENVFEITYRLESLHL